MKNIQDIYPLSALQQGMLYHVVDTPDEGVYIHQKITQLGATLDIERFKAAWKLLIERHVTLRTAFLWDGIDKPLQVVREVVDLPFEQRTYTTDQDLEAFLDADRRRGFDVVQAPLIRHVLFTQSDGSHVWVWTIHHLISDARSTQVLMDDLDQAYAKGHLDGRPEPVPFRSLIAAQQGLDEAKQTKHWTQRLEGFTSANLFPGVPGVHGHHRFQHTVDKATTRRLTTRANDLRVTLNTFVLAAWSLVAGTWSRSDDLVFGVTMAGRSASIPGSDEAVGLYINTLPMRVQLPKTGSISSWMTDIQRQNLDLLEDAQCPLPWVNRCSELPPKEPLFDSIFVFESFEDTTHDTQLPVLKTEFREHSNFGLAILVEPGDTLDIRFVFDGSRHHRASIERAAIAIEATLVGLCEADDFETLRADRGSIGTEFEFGPPLAHSAEGVVDSLIRQAAERPTAVAAVDPTQSICYADLERGARHVAHSLMAAGITTGTRVGLYMDRSVDMLVAMHGILRAGAVYVPLDPTYPDTHTLDLVERESIRHVVCDAPTPFSDLQEHRFTAATLPVDVAPFDQPVPSSSIAYIIFTSGSTGRPKGVPVTHANLAASNAARRTFYDDPVEVFLLLSSLSFDSSIAGLFWTLQDGGSLVLPPSSMKQDLDGLASLALTHGVTHLLTLPTLYRLMLDEAADSFRSLKTAVVAGEACPEDLFVHHRHHLPNTRLFNEYGPTESTVWSTVHEVTRTTEGAVPIGRPIPGVQVVLLSTDGERVPHGFEGEICIAGPTISQGYVDDVEETRRRFIELTDGTTRTRIYRTGDLGRWEANGDLSFLGRVDEQLKIRGHRIEPDAIRNLLTSDLRIADAVCAGRHDGPGGSARLIAWIEPSPGFLLDEAKLRKELGRTLLPQMVPDRIVILQTLPRLPNGKLDRQSLPAPTETSKGTNEAPRDDLERTLTDIWCELLVLDEVGIHQDFFALGGDSIMSIQLVSRARQAGVELRASWVAEHSTVARLASAVREASTVEFKCLVPLKSGVGQRPIICLHAGAGHVMFYKTFADQFGPDQPVYGVEPIGVGGEAPLTDLKDMVDRYVDEIRILQPKGPYRFVGYCMGLRVSLAVTRRLEEEGDSVELLALVDPTKPDIVFPNLPSRLFKVYQQHGVAGLPRQTLGRLRKRLKGSPVKDSDAHLEHVRVTCVKAIRDHQYPPCKAKALFIRSEHYTGDPLRQDLTWWKQRLGGFEEIRVRCRHQEILLEPNVRTVAQEITDYLTRR